MERLREQTLESLTEHPRRIPREREHLQNSATEREAALRAGLAELKKALAMLESRLDIHDTASVERDLAETRRLLEEVVASGRAERAR